jgi:multidrug resistance efflux pump
MNKKALLKDPVVLASIGAVVVIAIGSAFYYAVASKAPAVQEESVATDTTLTASGLVEPAQNPDLAFQSGGRVARINVSVGDKIGQGQLLASLDTSSLSAQRAQAEANLKAQQAKLDGMQAGPRDVDVSAKQTTVSQAKLTLANQYQTVANAINDAYGKADGAIHTDTDTLFSNPNSTGPTLLFTSSNSTDGTTLISSRIGAGNTLSAWNTETAALSAQSSNTDIETALASSLTHLLSLRDYSNAAIRALGNGISTSNFSQTQISAALTASSALHDSLSGSISSLQSMQQLLAADKLALQSAQNALDQLLAGSSAQDIEAQQAQVEAAQASVQNMNAQIANSQVVAPFSGTIASVHVKLGDIVPPNTIAISLNPSSALQITSYVSEAQISQISAGKFADVTLDAYGADKHFAATIVSVDHAPTMQGNVPAYKVTLQFDQNDPSISSGMTANITFAQ